MTPLQLEWTKQPPAEDGWYLIQKLNEDNDPVFEVALVRPGYASSLPKYVLWWAGPIPEPSGRLAEWYRPEPEPALPDDPAHLQSVARNIPRKV